MSWTDGPFMGFDTETTGVNTATDRIVTAACVEWRNGQTRERTWLADPGIPIPKQAQDVHGISTEYAKENGRPLDEVVIEVAKVLPKSQWLFTMPVSICLYLTITWCVWGSLPWGNG